MKAVAPIQAVETSTRGSTMTGAILARSETRVNPPNSPHRPTTEVIRPPGRVSSKNQPKVKPPAAETKCFARLKKKIPIPAPIKAEIIQARRYRPRRVVDGGLGDGGCRFSSTLMVSKHLE